MNSRFEYNAMRVEILTKAGSRSQIGICGFLRKRLTEKTKNVEYQYGIALSCVGNKSPRVATSSYSGVHALFNGFDMSRMLKGILAELTVGDIGVETPTYVRIGNSGALYHVASVNTATSEKRLNGFLERESNREIEQNDWLSVGYMHWDMNTSDGLTSAMFSASMRNLLTGNTSRVLTGEKSRKLGKRCPKPSDI